MEKERLSTELQAAFLELLDDTHASVRQALLAHFLEHPDAAAQFLKTIANGTNRHLAWHARWYLEELRFSDPVAEFRGFIRSLNYELETGALLLSRTVHPRIDIAACCDQFDALARRCRELFYDPMTTREKCRIINRVLFHENGFHGNADQYTDPLNSFIDQVLARRKGLPITLSILYLLVAHRLGLELEPVALPGHFVVGCYTEGEPFYIDPFERGLFRTPDDVLDWLRARQLSPQITDLAPTPVREVLCRCCRNLAQHYELAGEPERSRLFASFVEEFETSYNQHTQS